MHHRTKTRQRDTFRVERVVVAFAVVALILVPRTAHAALREMSTDRPDRTESPFTLDAGHLQVEMDALSWTHDRDGAAKSDAFGMAVTNMKLGLSPRADLQLVWVGALHVRESLPDLPPSRRTGTGDLTGRLKLNLFGNDGGGMALGLMPYLTFPTASAGLGVSDVEGGLIVPGAFALPRGWRAGAMLEADVIRDETGEGTHPEWVASLTASHAIGGGLAGYAELYGGRRGDSGMPWRGTADAGVTLAIGESLQFDTGANVGLSAASEDFTLFAGFSFRR